MKLNKKFFYLSVLLFFLSTLIVWSQEELLIPITTKAREGISLSANWRPNSFADWHFLSEDPQDEDSEDGHLIHRARTETKYFFGKGGEKKIEIIPNNKKGITQIVWSNQSLSGTIPEELTKLEDFYHLDLSQNKLANSLPSYIGDFPSLVNLYLNDNNFSGEIPKKIGNLSTLERLLLNDNNFSGEIPKEIGNLSNLGILHLHDNNLTGFEELEDDQSLTNLKVLTLKNNNLSTLPEDIINLSNLHLLDLRNNNLTRLFPKLEEDEVEINLDNLEYLNVVHNLLGYGGSVLSPKIGNLSSLNSITGYHTKNNWNPRMLAIDLRYNHLSEIPEEIGNLEALSSLKLDNNKISGFSRFDENENREMGDDDNNALPPTFKNFGNQDDILKFRLLSLYNNNLTGKIPAELGELKNLEILRLHNNNLSELLPSELFDLNNLLVLNLENNNLNFSEDDKDNESENFTAVSKKLQRLNLFRNELTSLPNGLELPSTRFLYLAENELENLPEDIGSNIGDDLQEFTLFKNNLTSLPESFSETSPENLYYLDLGTNKLEEFPQEVTSLNGLEYLNLARQSGDAQTVNGMQGKMSESVPQEINQLSNLKTFLLNNNELISLPEDKWSGLSNLVYFYGQNNNIENLPENMGDLNSLERLYLNNNSINEVIPNKLTETNNLLRLYLQENSIPGPLPNVNSWSKLERFFADQNKINGGISQEFVNNLSSLEYFSLSNNSLDGEISPAINRMSSLKWWDLSSNDPGLYADIPGSIGNLNNLEMFDFSNNKIEMVPDQINNLSNLHTLFGFENDVASFAESIENMNSLERLDFHNVEKGNRVGKFPTGVENLNNLIYFSFGENETATGEVPWEEWLGNYPQDALFLNNNQLTGTFTDGMLNETKDMVFFNARNNNFDGSLPES